MYKLLDIHRSRCSLRLCRPRCGLRRRLPKAPGTNSHTPLWPAVVGEVVIKVRSLGAQEATAVRGPGSQELRQVRWGQEDQELGGQKVKQDKQNQEVCPPRPSSTLARQDQDGGSVREEEKRGLPQTRDSATGVTVSGKRPRGLEEPGKRRTGCPHREGRRTGGPSLTSRGRWRSTLATSTPPSGRTGW